MYAVGFRITWILTDCAQKNPGHCSIATPNHTMQTALSQRPLPMPDLASFSNNILQIQERACLHQGSGLEMGKIRLLVTDELLEFEK